MKIHLESFDKSLSVEMRLHQIKHLEAVFLTCSSSRAFIDPSGRSVPASDVSRR